MGEQMTEEDELTMHDMCERVGRAIAPCRAQGDTTLTKEDEGMIELLGLDRGGFVKEKASHSIACVCAGTLVDPAVLNELYRLARDVADLAEDGAYESGQRDIADAIGRSSLFGNGSVN